MSYLYRQKGFRILARNYTLYGPKKLGEIDLVCQKGRNLVVVEVKTRSSEEFLPLEETVGWRKQGYLRRMAKLFLQQNPDYQNYALQIDVAAVLLDPVERSVKAVKLIENSVEDSD